MSAEKAGCLIDIAMLVVIAVISIALLTIGTGCAALDQDKSLRQQSYKVLYSRDGCVLYIDAMSVELVEKIKNEWDVEDCDIRAMRELDPSDTISEP